MQSHFRREWMLHTDPETLMNAGFTIIGHNSMDERTHCLLNFKLDRFEFAIS